MSISSRLLSTPFDPALRLHSEVGGECENQIAACDYSDDLEALNIQAAEAIVQKTKNRVVIQHRAWRLPDVFRSDDDYHLESPCLRQCRASRFGAPTQDSTIDRFCPSSTPTGLEMPFISSPVSYPPSSSPLAIPENRKRNGLNDRAQPSKKRLLGSPNVQPIFAKEAHSDLDAPPYDEQFPAKFQPRVASVQTGPFIDDDDDNNTVGDSSLLAVFQSAIGKAPRLPSPGLPAVQVDCNPQKTHSAGSLLARTSSGRAFSIGQKMSQPSISYEQLIAGRSTTAPGRATKSFYGVDIHDLLCQNTEGTKPVLSTHKCDTGALQPSIEEPTIGKTNRKVRTMMWTEKYRARKFTDLVGDERTHRDVLRWIKGWDPIVFSDTSRPKPKSKSQDGAVEDRPHRKILLLTGPPGLGKTTLAHVCARQAGYEVVEINASDERSKDVVKGRIRDIVGTENVKGVNTKDASGTVRKAGRPVCVVVDEVDGVVSGSGGSGEGGFIKALIDLVMLDQRNSTALKSTSSNTARMKSSRKGDRFRLLRPIILICNDVYHPSLRPLRSSIMTEIIQIRRPPLDKVATRLKAVFEKEGVACDSDGVRRLCEAAWGISNKRESRPNSSDTGEGDIRGVLVVGEWVAAKLRANAISSSSKQARLTKHWVEQNMLDNLSYGGGAARGLGRGGAKEVVERVFVDGAGFPKPISPATENIFHMASGKSLGVAELGKRHAMDRLRDIINTSGDTDRIMTDCFAAYPSQPFQDDTFLSKPNAAYDWLHFYDCLSSKVYLGQEWELSSYLPQPILCFHHFFASPNEHSWGNDQKGWGDDNEENLIPFSGRRADYMAFEAQKQNKAILLGLLSSLSIPLLRSFSSPEDIASGLVPYLNTILTPNVKPVVVGGSGEQRGIVSVRKEGERKMIERAVGVMCGVGVTFEHGRVDAGLNGGSTFIYRMEPAMDELTTFETASRGGKATAPPAGYAIRQALDQEYQKHLIRQSVDAAQSRSRAGCDPGQRDKSSSAINKSAVTAVEGKEVKIVATRRDFFGRVIYDVQPESLDPSNSEKHKKSASNEHKVWMSFHEGFSNAVRKPITLEDLIRGF